jgi:OOP family OmpA-OmpF porin
MKKIFYGFFIAFVAVSILSVQSCKTKKLAQKPAPPVATVPPPVEQKAPEAPPVQQQAPAPAVAPPNYDFSNIQFEFDSGILKTESYPTLDKAAVEMKKDPSARFTLNGYASAEGTDEHNMSLSVDRANAVKVYLVNTGVNADNLTAKGYGESNPVADNTTEAGKILNRRVEMKKQN